MQPARLSRCGVPAPAVPNPTKVVRSRLRSVRVAMLAALLVALAPEARATGTVSLRAQLNLPITTITDIWGYVDPNTNKEFMFVGSNGSDGVAVIDVSSPINPQYVTTITGIPGFDVKVWGHYLYTVNGGGDGNGYIMDISDPTLPAGVGTFRSAHNIFIDDQGYMYLEYPALRILDLNLNPTFPVLIFSTNWSTATSSGQTGEFPGPRCGCAGIPASGADVGGTTAAHLPDNDGHDATVVGNILYDFHGPFTRIYDVTDRANPVVLGTIDPPDVNYHHSGWPSADGNYLYICDELSYNVLNDITVWDISDPANAQMVGSYNDPNNTIHNLYVIGNTAYTAFYTAGFRVFDVTAPDTPVLQDGYDTTAKTGIFDGLFGVYPFSPSGYVFASDWDTGLYVFEYEDQATPTFIRAFDAKTTGDGIELTWDIWSTDEVTGFTIYRGRGDGFITVGGRRAPTERAWVDRGVVRGEDYEYVLGVDRAGMSEVRSRAVRVSTAASRLGLSQNVPNPFNPITTISYEIESAAQTTLDVYDAAGRWIRTIVDERLPAGRHAATWNGTDANGAPVSSGVYFYRLRSGSISLTKRMVLVK